MGSSRSKNSSKRESIEAETFYKDLCTNDLDSSPKQQVELHLSIKSAQPGSIYSIMMFLEGSQNSQQPISQTKQEEANMNGDVNFDLGVIIDYFFEKQQTLIFRVFVDQYSYDIKTTLGNIMGSRGHTLIKEFVAGKLCISGNSLESNGSNVNIKLNIRSQAGCPLFYILRKINQSQNILVSIYKSEVQVAQNNLYQFNQTKIPLNLIAKNRNTNTLNTLNNLIFEFYDFNRKKFLAKEETNIDDLLSQRSQFYVKTGLGTFDVSCQCSIFKSFTFLDYIKGGLQLNLSIGIDFTGSNGHPKDEFSLHRTGLNQANDYEKAIRSCGDILAYYDFDQLFPVYGYGAIIPGSHIVSHCFPINFSADPNINYIDNVLLTYRENLMKMNFSGPTFFAPLINTVIQGIKNNNSKNSYQILLILTDGMINDMNETTDALVEGSFLPLSVIIVGIGQGDFSNMELLDADINPLCDSRGRKACRDLVQFVPFYKFQSDGKRLSEEVLAEVPRQVVEYFTFIKSPPGDPINQSVI
jgi:hypothetical protein